MYLKRAIEDKLKETIKHYPVILVTGPRQVGKTTLLKEISKDTHKYITMDDLMQRKLLDEDSNLFFKNNSSALLLDEIQYVPDAFQAIKLKVDDHGKQGYYLLTGSQSFL
ncbi:AAA family ATPase [Anaerococcus obesiensis]|uniref:AAA family ATPase n=1 Tax=Anaerococcus obesiensis TaxID=1287640 RepID=A0A7T7USY0_9FIRM|nr:AAA family ATPase [Anaerococcus obesiensis]QQN55637.1 AAA family ATPase [Anaerococcus obesiensis]